jgi:hypothetical protein
VSTSKKKVSTPSPAQRSRHLGADFETLALERLTSVGIVRVEQALPDLNQRQTSKVNALVKVLRSGYVVLGYDTEAEGLFWNSNTGRLVLVEVSGAVGTKDGRHGLLRGDSARKVTGSLLGAASICTAAGVQPDGLIVTNGLPDLSSNSGCYLNALAKNPGFYRFSTEWLSDWEAEQPLWMTFSRAALLSHLQAGTWVPRKQQYNTLLAA